MAHQFYAFRTWLRMILADAARNNLSLKVDDRVANLLADAYSEGTAPTVKATADWNCWETESFLAPTGDVPIENLLRQAA